MRVRLGVGRVQCNGRFRKGKERVSSLRKKENTEEDRRVGMRTSNKQEEGTMALIESEAAIVKETTLSRVTRVIDRLIVLRLRK